MASSPDLPSPPPPAKRAKRGTGDPVNWSVVKARDAIDCCRKRPDTGATKYALEVFRLIGEYVTALGDQINFINDKRDFFGFTETGFIGLVEPKTLGGHVDPNTSIEDYAIKFRKPGAPEPKGTQSPVALAIGGTLITATTALAHFDSSIEAVSRLQDALQRIPTKTKTKTDTKDDHCYKCVKEHLLSQKKARKRGTRLDGQFRHPDVAKRTRKRRSDRGKKRPHTTKAFRRGAQKSGGGGKYTG